MADMKGSLFPTLLGPALTNADRVHIIDTSDTTTQPAGPGGANKTMLVSEFIAGINSLGGGAFVKAGISGGQTGIGGTAATDRLVLKATSHGAPTGAGVGIFGGLNERFRANAAGVIVMGNDPANADTNAFVMIRRGTGPNIGNTAAGTALQIVGGDDDNLGAAARGFHVGWRLANGGTGIENNAMTILAQSCDPAYPGNTALNGACPQALGGPRLFHTMDQTDPSKQPVLFACNPQVRIGVTTAGPNGTIIPVSTLGVGCTQHPIINCVEVGVDDDAANIAPNAGFGIRVIANSVNDFSTSYLVSGSNVYPSSCLVGYGIDTSPKGGVPGPAYTNHSFLLGETCSVSGVRYMAKHAGSLPSPTGEDANWHRLTNTKGASQWSHWVGPYANGFAAGSVEFGVVGGDGSSGAAPGSIYTAGWLQLTTGTTPGAAPGAGQVRIFVRASDGALCCQIGNSATVRTINIT